MDDLASDRADHGVDREPVDADVDVDIEAGELDPCEREPGRGESGARAQPAVAAAGPGGDADTDADAATAAPERRSGTVDAALHGSRLDRAVVALAPEWSRTWLQSLIEGGHVAVDDRAVLAPSRRVTLGQRLVVELVPTAESRAFRPEPIALSIVHEDAHLLVVDKPAGMVVHPAAGNWSGTLLNALLAHHPGAAALPRAGIVHRLDKDTSGLLVVGKTLPAVTALSRAIAARAVHREYLALAHGAWSAARQGTSIESPIGRDPRSRIRMAVLASGRAARTDVDLLAQAAGCSALRCRLHTGRTHQIRVHLASRGHPLVADGVYGGAPALGMQRQALHARRLAFAHPADGHVNAFEAPLPADLAAAWQRLVAGDPQAG